MKWVEVNGAVLRYEVSGQGKPVILVHEMGGTLNSWDAVAPLLARTHRVLRYDQRGAGLSEKTSGRLELDVLADDIDALARHAGIGEPVALVGMAVGTAVAMRHALRRPDAVACIIGFSPVTQCPVERRDAVLAHAGRIETDGLRTLAPTSIPNILPEALRHDEQAFLAARARWLANDPRSFAAIYRMFAHLDMSADYAAITTPCLMIGATHDGLRPPA
ncbi:MAG: alpha/beta fold hydrolase, partial [Hyphomicrobiales bacterium]|nr:alpha/beta fold hydrolase [Hyphomicrobiales bacterium]